VVRGSLPGFYDSEDLAAIDDAAWFERPDICMLAPEGSLTCACGHVSASVRKGLDGKGCSLVSPGILKHRAVKSREGHLHAETWGGGEPAMVPLHHRGYA
jgi:hypothetical protein